MDWTWFLLWNKGNAFFYIFVLHISHQSSQMESPWFWGRKNKVGPVLAAWIHCNLHARPKLALKMLSFTWFIELAHAWGTRGAQWEWCSLICLAYLTQSLLTEKLHAMQMDHHDIVVCISGPCVSKLQSLCQIWSWGVLVYPGTSYVFIHLNHLHLWLYVSEMCHLQKFLDDSSIVGCINNQGHWWPKTRDLDFQKNQKPPNPVCHSGARGGAYGLVQFPWGTH